MYPPRDVGREPLPDAFALPNDLQRIYRETKKALNNDLPILCGVGIRAIVETVTKEKSAPGADLSKRIDGLVDMRVLTPDGATILHKLRVLGNNAAHEVKAHKSAELNVALDVVDHVLTAVYLLPERAKRILK